MDWKPEQSPLTLPIASRKTALPADGRILHMRREPAVIEAHLRNKPGSNRNQDGISSALPQTSEEERESNMYVVTQRIGEEVIPLYAVVDGDYDKFMDGKPSYTLEELEEKVPKEYHGEIEVFMKREADKLPPHRQIDHEIHLEEGRSPPLVRNYKPMSTQELEAVKKYIDEHLGKGLIRSGASPAAAPVLLVKKPGGGIRVYVNYRALNEIAVKNRYLGILFLYSRNLRLPNEDKVEYYSRLH